MCKIIDGKLQFTTIILFWVVNMQYASDVRICRTNRLILSAALHHSLVSTTHNVPFHFIIYFASFCFSVAQTEFTVHILLKSIFLLFAWPFLWPVCRLFIFPQNVKIKFNILSFAIKQCVLLVSAHSIESQAIAI